MDSVVKSCTMSEEFQSWACAALDGLGLPDASIIIQYLEPLEDPKEVREYLSSMLDVSKPQHCKFISEFIGKQASSKTDKRFYRKGEAEEVQTAPQGKKKNKGPATVNETKNKKKDQTSENSNKVSDNQRVSPPLTSDNGANKKKGNKENAGKQTTPPPTVASIGAKKKTKFVNLYAGDGSNKDVVMLSGRNMCECLASKHKLVNNCLACGRIVCEQEGAGPCMFCDNMILSRDEEAGIVAAPTPHNNKPVKTNKKATVKDAAAEIQKAVCHKDKLLEYDRTSEKRTQVFDDESDYFDSNSRWISKENREILQSKEQELKDKKYDRSQNLITVDLLGRKILVDETNDPGIYDPDDPVVKAILEHKPDDIFSASDRQSEPFFEMSSRPMYVDNIKGGGSGNLPTEKHLKNPVGTNMSRLQDRELQEMTDQGKCLSMHQPWASLLIAGIKKHEGRVWYSAHRGRLWIASAAKVPSPEEIAEVEGQYVARTPEGEAPVFPQHYPPGCLLGHVDVVDVLPQEEYRMQHPEGESESAYVFVCTNPKEMVFKFPIRGEHKIFKIDSKIHQAAKKALK